MEKQTTAENRMNYLQEALKWKEPMKKLHEVLQKILMHILNLSYVGTYPIHLIKWHELF